jgi:hypothetical protein
MSDDSVVALRDLTEPPGAERTGKLLGADLESSELELTVGGPAISDGALVAVQTSQTICVGYVLGRAESVETPGPQRLRIRIDHWVALQDVSVIQKLWSQEQPG